MRIPLAPAGLREMALMMIVFGGAAVLAAGLGLAGYLWFWPIAALFALLLAGGLAFFRDPERVVALLPDVMLAPADGKIVETAVLEHHDLIGGPATRISIFLSIFDVHVNRSPCAGVVRSISYQPGQFVDARRPDCGIVNESNTVVIDPADPQDGPVVVRQISGAIARRIVCSIKAGDRLEPGQRIGMIKFGSRTELILPGRDRYQPMVRLGECARAGITVLARRVQAQPACVGGQAPRRAAAEQTQPPLSEEPS